MLKIKTSTVDVVENKLLTLTFIYGMISVSKTTHKLSISLGGQNVMTRKEIVVRNTQVCSTGVLDTFFRLTNAIKDTVEITETRKDLAEDYTHTIGYVIGVRDDGKCLVYIPFSMRYGKLISFDQSAVATCKEGK